MCVILAIMPHPDFLREPSRPIGRKNFQRMANLILTHLRTRAAARARSGARSPPSTRAPASPATAAPPAPCRTHAPPAPRVGGTRRARGSGLGPESVHPRAVTTGADPTAREARRRAPVPAATRATRATRPVPPVLALRGTAPQNSTTPIQIPIPPPIRSAPGIGGRFGANSYSVFRQLTLAFVQIQADALHGG